MIERKYQVEMVVVGEPDDIGRYYLDYGGQRFHCADDLVRYIDKQERMKKPDDNSQKYLFTDGG